MTIFNFHIFLQYNINLTLAKLFKLNRLIVRKSYYIQLIINLILMKRHLFQILAGVTVILSTVVFLSSGNNKTLSDLALANIEAIASGEGTAVSTCYFRGSGERQDWFFECDSYTSPEMIYPCPGDKAYGSLGASSMCTK